MKISLHQQAAAVRYEALVLERSYRHRGIIIEPGIEEQIKTLRAAAETILEVKRSETVAVRQHSPRDDKPKTRKERKPKRVQRPSAFKPSRGEHFSLRGAKYAL